MLCGYGGHTADSDDKSTKSWKRTLFPNKVLSPSPIKEKKKPLKKIHQSESSLAGLCCLSLHYWYHVPEKLPQNPVPTGGRRATQVTETQTHIHCSCVHAHTHVVTQSCASTRLYYTHAHTQPQSTLGTLQDPCWRSQAAVGPGPLSADLPPGQPPNPATTDLSPRWPIAPLDQPWQTEGWRGWWWWGWR